MILTFWRKAHLILALTSGIFLLITSVTGVILSFKPIQSELNNSNISNTPNKSVSELLYQLDSKYDEIIDLQITEDRLIRISVIDQKGEYDEFYINAKTLEKSSIISKEPRLFAISKAIHRSLFLGVTGRIFIGISSFMLLLLSITGTILLIKRQLGLKNILKPVYKSNFYSYWHVKLGRITLIFIIIIAGSGTYLSLDRFGIIPESKIGNITPLISKQKKDTEKLRYHALSNVSLSDLKSIEYPFSDDPEDYFIINLIDQEIQINQVNGQIISHEQLDFKTLIDFYSLKLHTGQGSIIWSLFLCVSSISILFFIVSGTKMALLRLNRKKQTFNSENSEYVILVGSEGGSTMTIAKEFQQILIQKGKRIFLDNLNNYQIYPRLKHLIIFTSTHGEGIAPTNASEFLKRFNNFNQVNNFQYAIVGFGSKNFPLFCQFAIDVSNALQEKGQGDEFLPLELINNRSSEDLDVWRKSYLEKSGILSNEKLVVPDTKTLNLLDFELVSRTDPFAANNFSFTLELKVPNTNFKSGDLISIYTPDKAQFRYYSIGKSKNNNILLFIRKIENGICSNYLSNVKPGEIIQGQIEKNNHFNFPQQSKSIITIANGVGIAPFVGMARENNIGKPFYLYWGAKYQGVIDVIESDISHLLLKKHISQRKIVLSQTESTELKYVQDLISKDEKFITHNLLKGSTFMICGSIAMKKSVLKTLDTISTKNLNLPISHFENEGLIKTDCY